MAADNLGKVIVTMPPAVTPITHLPKLEPPRKAIWDFGGDGYSIYQRVGGLETLDFIAAHLLVVKDNSGKRKIGEILEAIGGDESIKGAATSASDRLKAGGGGMLAVSAAVGLITPVVSLIGGLLKKKKDKVIATISGSVFLNAERKRRDQLSDTIRSADGNVTVDANALLFDGTADDDFEALENPDLGLELAGQVRAANV